MPKFLFQATYSAEGIKGLEKDKAVGRKAALSEAVESLGGNLGVWSTRLGSARGLARQCQRHGIFACRVGVRSPSRCYDNPR
jgi:hypothetical protein